MRLEKYIKVFLKEYNIIIFDDEKFLILWSWDMFKLIIILIFEFLSVLVDYIENY